MKAYSYRIFIAVAFGCLCLTSIVEAQKKKKAEPKTIPQTSQRTEIKPVAKPKPANQKSLLSEMDLAVVDEINQARSDPQKFVAYLEEYKKAMKGNVLYMPGKTGIVMIEGTPAIDDAINDLKQMSKFQSLSVSNGLFRAAHLQLTDLMEDSSLSHRGKNGSDLEQRLFKFGFPGISIAENICYKVAVAREVVMTMILDDGLKSRSHRKNIFNSKFKQVGVSCGVSNKKEALCVAVFADSFKDIN